MDPEAALRWPFALAGLRRPTTWADSAGLGIKEARHTPMERYLVEQRIRYDAACAPSDFTRNVNQQGACREAITAGMLHPRDG